MRWYVRSEKLLVYLKPKFLGDSVMATPMLKVLASEFSDRSILVPKHVQTMLQEDQTGYQFVTPGPLRGISAVWREGFRLRKMGFDTCVLVNRSIRSAIVARLAGIPKRIGHDTEHRGLLLTMRVPYSKLRFEGSCYGDLVEAMGIPGDFTRVHLTVTDAELKRGKELVLGATVGVQPGASFAEKTLPADRLGSVVSALVAKGHKVVMVGGKEEASFGALLQSFVASPLVDLIGKCSLRESMGAVASLKACIGGSTGIMHIAAAVGCPSVTVFGPTLSSKWGHNYAPHHSIQIPGGNIKDMDPEVVLKATVEAMEAYPL
jgi:heptosyltransferase II